MEQAADIISWVLLIGGSFFVLVGGIGVLRMPDVYTRSHAAGITDTLGAMLILVGLMFQAGPTLITVKLGIILLFLLFTSPTSSHALNHTAWSQGLKPILDEDLPPKKPTPSDGED
jgi:multicomponent Na+:H+ antiporter subunit G